jgi:hypothetical protein
MVFLHRDAARPPCMADMRRLALPCIDSRAYSNSLHIGIEYPPRVADAQLVPLWKNCRTPHRHPQTGPLAGPAFFRAGVSARQPPRCPMVAAMGPRVPPGSSKNPARPSKPVAPWLSGRGGPGKLEIVALLSRLVIRSLPSTDGLIRGRMRGTCLRGMGKTAQVPAGARNVAPVSRRVVVEFS